MKMALNLTFIKGCVYKLYYAVLYAYNTPKRKKLKIMSCRESIEYILEHKCSVSRYGDGEIRQMKPLLNAESKEHFNIGFQSYDERMARRLIDVFRDNIPNHMVGIPGAMFGSGLSKYKPSARRFWKYISNFNIDVILEVAKSDTLYLDSLFTRFYIDYQDKTHLPSYSELLKRLWEGRHVLIVEGAQTRIGCGNDLLDGAVSVKRIICPSTNAFDKIDEIEAAINKWAEEDTLVLLALGPTATVIAADMARIGKQALDIGHIDIEYEWMRLGVDDKVAIEGKYVNEVAGGRSVHESSDDKYQSQVLGII